MQKDLIYDVGMHNGDDTAYYLSKGYRVVAIEANPELAAAGEQRFSQEICDGRLIIVNAGVFYERGEKEFWINTSNTVLSSFDQEMATHWSGEVKTITVRCVRFEDVIAKHGVPYYLKIDVEGADSECLSALQPSDLPKYVSAEAHSLLPLCQLRVLGYSDFKCIPQRYHNDPHAGLNPLPMSRRLLSEATRLMKTGVRNHAQRVSILRSMWNAASQVRKSGNKKLVPLAGHASQPAASRIGTSASNRAELVSHFPIGSSGPFGEETFGTWRTFDAVAYDWLHLHEGLPKLSNLSISGWFDFHARRAD